MPDSYLIPAQDANSIDFEELMQQDSMLLKIIAAREDTHPSVLARLACHDNIDIQLTVAGNPNTPPEILSVLADEKLDRYGEAINGDIIRAVAANPSTPQKVLGEKIRKCSHGHVNALKNENAPLESILDYMLAQIGADERGALNFNQRFNDLIRTAKKLDCEQGRLMRKAEDAYQDDFDVDKKRDGSRWS